MMPAPAVSAVPRSALLTGAAGALPSRTVAVLEAIKHAILTGELEPGRPLVETDLAELLGVSKTPVREARAVAAGHDWLAARTALAHAASARDQAERSLANRDFHRALYAGCGNPLLVKMLDDLRDATALVTVAAWRDEPSHPVPSWEHEAAEHHAILQAAQDGDAGHAAALLSAHITSFVERNLAGGPQERHQEKNS